MGLYYNLASCFQVSEIENHKPPNSGKSQTISDHDHSLVRTMMISYMLRQIVIPIADFVAVFKRTGVSQGAEMKISEVSN